MHWLEAVGAKVTVQQKLMRHTDVRTTFNVFGYVVTDEMTTAARSVSNITFGTKGAQNFLSC